ncbi:Protein of unknown function [Gryllus bimaculatus]|nr:Protein of unknown function [Gryllus bimaculatus]
MASVAASSSLAGASPEAFSLRASLQQNVVVRPRQRFYEDRTSRPQKTAPGRQLDSPVEKESPLAIKAIHIITFQAKTSSYWVYQTQCARLCSEKVAWLKKRFESTAYRKVDNLSTSLK